MAKTMEVLCDGSVFRPSKHFSFGSGKKYTITVTPSVEALDVENDPAFDISSLAVATGISDLAAEHDHYLYGKSEMRMDEE
jgi:hypothetical protein